MYKINLKILGEDYKSKGKTVSDAVENIPIGWKEVKSKGVLTVEKYAKKNDNVVLVDKYERIFSMPDLKRLKMNKVSKDLWIKRIESVFEK